jgi:hypothetical protein
MLHLIAIAALSMSSLQAPSPTPPPAGSITGRVTGESGAPVRKVLLRLAALDRRETRSVTSDAQGRFEFKDIAPGRYLLGAAKGGFVPAQYGQKRAFAQGTAIEVTAGATIELTVNLSPGASIDGIVVDEFGDPVADAIVMTLRNQYAGGRRRLVGVGRVLTTNDRGEYRLFGLPPGTYVVSASPLPNQNATDGASRSGYAPSYYPGTPDAGLAAAVALEPGEHRTGVDIAMTTIRTSSISGVVVNSESELIRAGVVTATNRGSGIPLVAGAVQVKPDGTFSLDGLAPGHYRLQAASNAAPVAGVPIDVASAEIDLASADLAGVRLSVPRLSQISGRVLVDGTAASPAGAQVRVRPDGDADTIDVSSTTIAAAADGTFGGSTRPGQLLIDVVGAAPKLFLRSVTINGGDITDTGVAVDAGEQLTDIVVSLTANPSVIDGKAGDDKPPADYVAVVFDKDRSHWQFRSRRIVATRAQRDGTFQIKGLPDGTYLAIGVDYLEPGEERDPDLLEQWSARASEVTVTNGSSARVNIHVIRR